MAVEAVIRHIQLAVGKPGMLIFLAWCPCGIRGLFSAPLIQESILPAQPESRRVFNGLFPHFFCIARNLLHGPFLAFPQTVELSFLQP